MVRSYDIDALVVGAGPVGLMTAVMLAERGIRIQIIDQQWRTAAHSYACALHPETLRLLARLGMVDEMLSKGLRIDRVAFYEGATRQGEIRLGELGGDYPFVVVVPQSDLEQVLERRLGSKYYVKVDWNHRFARLDLVGGKTVAYVDKMCDTSTGYIVAHLERTIERSMRAQAGFIVGADGHDSLTRQHLGISMQAGGPPDYFEVYELELNEPLDNEVRVVFHEDTTNVLWPLPENYCRWSFQVTPESSSEEERIKERLPVRFVEDTEDPRTLERLQTLLTQRAPWFEHSTDHLEWSVGIHFQRRLARQFGHDHQWLVGDAAHQTSPVGMQSMNVGMREAEDLADRINQVMNRQSPPDPLTDYGVKWHAEWQRLLGLEQQWRLTDNAPAWVRKRANLLQPCLPASGDDLAKLVAQLGIVPA